MPIAAKKISFFHKYFIDIQTYSQYIHFHGVRVYQDAAGSDDDDDEDGIGQELPVANGQYVSRSHVYVIIQISDAKDGRGNTI